MTTNHRIRLTERAELAKGYTVDDYWRDVDDKNRDRISGAIHRRFRERYLEPIYGPKVHGFTKMAVACLMVEALEGSDTSKRGQGEHAFCSFFDAHVQFAPLRGHSQDFYKGVRCGILHQAETTLGWRIRRNTPGLLKEAGGIRTLNASKFVIALGTVLDEYRDQLRAAAWDADMWTSLREKLKTVCKNCDATSAAPLETRNTHI